MSETEILCASLAQNIDTILSDRAERKAKAERKLHIRKAIKKTLTEILLGVFVSVAIIGCTCGAAYYGDIQRGDFNHDGYVDSIGGGNGK